MVLSLSFTIFDIALDRRHLGKPGTSSRFLSTFPIFAKNRMRGPDKFRQIWLTVRLPLFLQKDKLAGQTIAAAACETIGSNPGTPSPYLFCYRLSCRSTRHNSYAAPSVFRNCRKTRSRSSPSSAAATSASRRWSICSQVAAAWPKFPAPRARRGLSTISASTTVGIWSICPVTVTPAHRKPNATSSPKSSPTTYSDANGCTSCSCWSIPDWSPRRSTCALSKCSAGRASLSASSLPKPTNCRPHSSHAASNATNKCSVNSGRGCLRCSAPRAKNGRAAKRSWTSSANV